MELKLKGGVAYFKGDPGYDDLEYNDRPCPVVLIDEEDKARVAAKYWAIWDRSGRLSVKNEKYLGLGERYIDSDGYVKKRILTRKIELHRFLLGNPEFRIKALNGNYLDCRKANLAPVKG